MKKLSLILATLSLTSFFSLAHADYNLVNCDSVRGTNTLLTLVIANQNLMQVRVLLGGSRARPIMPRKLANQNIKDITLYSLMGTASLLKVDNTVLTDNFGHVQLESDEFSCLN
jgi:hypothetical protein